MPPLAPATAPPIVTKRWSSVGHNATSSVPPEATRAPPSVLDCLDDLGIARGPDVDDIIGNVRTYLSRRHAESRLPARRSSHDGYLVTTEDIAGILGIVISSLRGLQHEHSTCLTTVLPKGADAKPSPCLRAIVPQLTRRADPATTVGSGSAKATIISRSSVTEVDWGTSTNADSNRATMGEPGASSPKPFNFDWPPPASDERPLLHPRPHTQPTLYESGIDAHSYSYDDHAEPPRSPTCLLPEPMVIHEVPPMQEGALPPPQIMSSISPGSKMGSEIGVSTHRRKSSTKSTVQPEANDDNMLLNKLRRYSFLPLLDDTPENLRSTPTPPQPTDEISLQAGPRRSSRDVLRKILERAPPLPKPDRAGIYHAITGAARAPNRGSMAGRHLSRSGDHVPHMCADEMPRHDSEAEILDWIG